MEKLEEAIIVTLEQHPGLSDRELTDALLGFNKSTQPVNQGCRALEMQGEIIRKPREDGLVGSWLSTRCLARVPQSDFKGEGAGGLSDKRMKQILEKYLLALGWYPEIQWRYTGGVDIEAKLGSQRWVIEVKNPPYPALNPNDTFVAVLGEILQRMDHGNSKYSIAIPDAEPFRRLWRRLPSLARGRTGITALFVNPSGLVSEKTD
jgi:hypothetical protein